MITFFENSPTIIANLILLCLYYFAIPHHLKTFFRPFKKTQIIDNGPQSLQRQIDALTYNIISAGIGMILRIVVISVGLIALALVTFGSLLLEGILLATWVVWKPIVVMAQTIRENNFKAWKQLATDNPCLALNKIFTQTSFGQFLIRKLVLNIPDIEKICVNNGSKIDTSNAKDLGEIVVILAQEFSPLKDYLEEKLLDHNDIQRIANWYNKLGESSLINLLDRDSVTKVSGVGADWAYGYTPNIYKYLINQASSQFPRMVGRDEEVSKIEKILSKTVQNSVIVTGEAGVGRHAVVDEFSRRLYDGKISQNLVGFRTMYLDLKSAIASQRTFADQRKMVLDLLDEARWAENIILVIDDIDKFLETAGEKIDTTDVFSQMLSDGTLRIIGLTTDALYEKCVSQNTTLLKLFSRLQIDVPDENTVFEEMELSIVPVLEHIHKVEISYVAIKEAIVTADRYISSVPFPEKAINIMDEAITFIKAEHPHMKSLWAGDIQRFLAMKTKIPIGALNKDEKEKLNNLEVLLHKRIIGQNVAIEALAKSLRRSILSVSSRNKPIGTFLFLGPTGVGKTETAKTLAETYFGNESRIIRFDMSEYQGQDGITKLIGSAQDEKPGKLTSALADNPFSIILFDEIEKAPPLILNLFLPLIDEGYITDALGRKVMAKQNIIIGTSNAGALFIKEQAKKGILGTELSNGLIEYIQEKAIFTPEFLNRFDGVIVFEPLTKDQIKQVALKMLEILNKRLSEKKIQLKITDELINRLADEGFDPAFGARAMQRYIQNVVEDEIAKKLLATNVKPGSIIEL